MKTIALDDFLNEGILVEKKFRQKIEQINWQKYENENVLTLLMVFQHTKQNKKNNILTPTLDFYFV